MRVYKHRIIRWRFIIYSICTDTGTLCHTQMKWRTLRVRYCREFTDTPAQTKVQHSRPGQRRKERRLMCSEVQRCVVVQRLSRHQPQRRIPSRPTLDVCQRYCVATLEGRLLLAEIHRDEDETVWFLNHLNTHAQIPALLLTLAFK